MNRNKLQPVSFLIFFVIIGLLTFLVFQPFIKILILAAVCGTIFHPSYRKLAVGLRSKGFAAFVVVLLVLIIIIVPLFFLGDQIVKESQVLYLQVQNNQASYLQSFDHLVESQIRPIFSGFSFHSKDYLARLFDFIFVNFGTLLSQVAYVLFETLVFLLSFFFFLRHGEELLSSVKSLSPFSVEATEETIKSVRKTVYGVMQGTFLTALVRFAFFAVGFYLFDIPASFILASLAAIVGAIPGVGTLAGLIPALVFLFFEGNYLAASGLAVFGALIIILVDNLMEVHFFGKGLDVSSIFVLLSIIGGIILLGPIGFILGPLILSIFLSLVRVYGNFVRSSE